jgi:molybdate transport system substrate-binding protein
MSTPKNELTEFQRAETSLVLNGISSMATKSILLELSKLYLSKFNVQVNIESMGGVDATKRLQNGENYDIALLGSDAIDRLIQEGHLIHGSRQDWVESQIAVAVQSGAEHPDISNESNLKKAVVSSKSLSYSTGPSGVYLEKLFDRWGLSSQVKSCLVVPPPGTPVGSLVANGKVALGFQQLSELIAIPGIDVLGTLPREIAHITIFSSGIPKAVSADAARLKAAQQFLKFLSSDEVNAIKKEHGMKGLSA